MYNEWFRRTEQFLRAAKRALQEGDFEIACFLAQQYAELLLKAVLLLLTGSKPYTHDLVELLRLVSEVSGIVPDDSILDAAEKLTPHCVLARYANRTVKVYGKICRRDPVLH